MFEFFFNGITSHRSSFVCFYLNLFETIRQRKWRKTEKFNGNKPNRKRIEKEKLWNENEEEDDEKVADDLCNFSFLTVTTFCINRKLQNFLLFCFIFVFVFHLFTLFRNVSFIFRKYIFFFILNDSRHLNASWSSHLKYQTQSIQTPNQRRSACQTLNGEKKKMFFSEKICRNE